MQFTYRGVHYEREPLTLEVTEGEITGKYRGQEWKYHYPRHIPQLRPKFLHYRGVSYSTCVTSTEVTTTQLPERIPQPKRPTTSTTSKKYSTVPEEAARIHLNSIRRSLEHRLQVAKASGNEQLIQQLEKESKQFTVKA